MSEKNTPSWEAEARALPARDFTPRQPLHVLIGEAHDLAALSKKHWKARYGQGKELLEPGLELAGAKIKATIAEHLRSLAEAVQQAHSAYLLTAGSDGRKELMERGHFVVSELKSLLEWHFDDGIEDENDVKLASVSAEHLNDPATPDALASELRDYAALAVEHQEALEGVGGFEGGLLEEAHALSKQLLALPSERGQAPERVRERDSLELRNRLGWLLLQKMNLVRGAARFVFRHHPELARPFSSTYERKKRSAARRASKPSPPPPTP